MFIEIKVVQTNSTHRRAKKTRRLVTCSCNTCGRTYEFNYNSVRLKKAIDGVTYCSKKCADIASMKDGPTGKKRAATNLDRYGHTCVLGSRLSRERLRRSSMERYGIECPLASVKLRKEGMLRTHGVEHPMLCPAIKKQRQETFEALHGITSSAQLTTTKATMLERYGAETYWRTALHRQRCRENANDPRMRARQFEARKRNGYLLTSRPENEFHDMLCKAFNDKDVERHRTINGWSIDFYIASIDVYVQFDGVYWHGLDRPIEEVRRSNGPVDRAIVRKYDRDIEQVTWFMEHGMRLVRVTDRDDAELAIEGIKSHIRRSL